MSIRLLLPALFALAFAARIAAQANPPAAPASPEPAPPTPAAPAMQIEGAEPQKGGATRDKDTLSVDFPDEDIKTILRNVADLFELNLVVPDTLTGKTSIKLRDVTWRQIFQVVLAPVGYTYIEEGNIIKIVSHDSLQQEPTATEVFILNYAKAGDIKPTLDALVDAAAGGKIVIDARSNALVITERPSKMNRIRPIIESLDKATDQVMIESKFVEVTDRDIRNIGLNWASLQAYQIGAGSINQTFNRGRGQDFGNGSQSNNQTNTGTTGTTSNATNSTTGQTNSPTNTSTVTNTNGAITTAGITGTNTAINTAANTTAGSTTGATTGATKALTDLMSLTNTGSISRLANAVFSAADFNLILSALKTQNNTRIVSNPTVVTLNNTESYLNVGEEFPVPNYTYNQERGAFEVAGFTYKPIGIILKVTPQVNARGFIKLSIEPEVSQRNGETTFGGAGGASIPIIATRKAKTQVSLKDGFTMGIGGLMRSQATHGGTKVPLLGDIPLVGKLFTSRSVNDEITNLLIFITARTVSAEGASVQDVFDPRSVRAVQITRDDLPGYRSADPFAAPEAAAQPRAAAPVPDSGEPAPAKKPFFRLTHPSSSGGNK